MGNNSLCHRKVRFGHEFKDAKTTALWPRPRPTQPSPTQVRPAPPNSLKSSCFCRTRPTDFHGCRILNLMGPGCSSPSTSTVAIRFRQALRRFCKQRMGKHRQHSGQESATERERERERERTEKASTEIRKQRATKQLHGPKPMKSMDKINRNLFFNEITINPGLSMQRVSF